MMMIMMTMTMTMTMTTTTTKMHGGCHPSCFTVRVPACPQRLRARVYTQPTMAIAACFIAVGGIAIIHRSRRRSNENTKTATRTAELCVRSHPEL